MLIKFVMPELELSENMAIVGSSDRLLKKELGSKIDIFDNVIRFNRAPVDGYETFVGSKTYLRVVNQHVMINNPINNKLWKGQSQYFVKNLRNCKILHYGMEISQSEIKNNVHESNQVFIFKAKSENAPLNPPNSSDRFSIGVGFINLCVISGIIPHIFGFDIEDRYRGHYWEYKPEPSKSHNILKEKEFLKDLEKNGKIILYR